MPFPSCTHCHDVQTYTGQPVSVAESILKSLQVGLSFWFDERNPSLNIIGKQYSHPDVLFGPSLTTHCNECYATGCSGY